MTWKLNIRILYGLLLMQKGERGCLCYWGCQIRPRFPAKSKGVLVYIHVQNIKVSHPPQCPQSLAEMTKFLDPGINHGPMPRAGTRHAQLVPGC